ncbi:MAG TPA: S8 family serine peptidase [Solirubrobacterales bacterium]|nr:S8 family serine peptidase [Solirubrobacterales bacterium]
MSPEAGRRGPSRGAIGTVLVLAIGAALPAAATPATPSERPGATARGGLGELRVRSGGPLVAGDRVRASARGPRFVPGEVIVGFRRRAQPTERAAVRAATRTVLDERLGVPRAELLEIRGDRSPEALAHRLERLPEVAYAQPNYIRSATEIPNDPAFATLWGLHNTGQVVRSQAGIAAADISATAAWDVTTGDRGLIVAVVDTGVDAAHPDLAANIAPGGRDFVDDDEDPSDPEGHGTHVAGTIGAVGGNGVGVAGVAHEVGLLPIRVLDATGNGTDAEIAAGFAYAASHGARIVNASLGGEGAAPVLDAAIAAAPETLFVVAAGNGGEDGIGDDNEATPIFPCNSPEPNVICVAATDSRDELAGFSNFGATSVDLAAPGADVNSTAASGVDREFFFEGFEEPLAGRWIPGGINNSWGRVGPPAFSGDWSVADSPAGNYSPGTNAWIDSPQVNLAAGSNCDLGFAVERAIPDPQDQLLIEVSDDGFATGVAFALTGTEDWIGFATSISDFDGSPTLQVGLRMLTDNDANVGAGAHVDQISILCTGAGPGYDVLSGTSMATPHVAGVAALVLAEVPDAPVPQLRDAILDSVDTNLALTGFVATGGRLNAAAAVNAVPPRATIISGPSGLIADRTPAFGFTASKPGSFECRVDAAPFAPCASGHLTESLADGPHTFRVRAVNEHGAGSAAARSFAVDATAPRTRIVKKPKRRGRKRVARFRFRADEAPVSFSCRIDRRKWRPCASPRRYRVRRGRHVFHVRATDQLGHTGPVKRWKFRVRR